MPVQRKLRVVERCACVCGYFGFALNWPSCQQDNHHVMRTEPREDASHSRRNARFCHPDCRYAWHRTMTPEATRKDIDKLRARFAKLEGFLVL
jgi:hypothetical protein